MNLAQGLLRSLFAFVLREVCGGDRTVLFLGTYHILQTRNPTYISCSGVTFFTVLPFVYSTFCDHTAIITSYGSVQVETINQSIISNSYITQINQSSISACNVVSKLVQYCSTTTDSSSPPRDIYGSTTPSIIPRYIYHTISRENNRKAVLSEYGTCSSLARLAASSSALARTSSAACSWAADTPW